METLVQPLEIAKDPFPPRRVYRGDGWQNVYTGLGVSARDKTVAGYFAGDWTLDDRELSDLYHGSHIARRIVSIKPREMLRAGYEVVLPDPEAAKRLKVAAKRFQVNVVFREAMRWSRLYGGGLIILGAIDRGDALSPLNKERISSLEFLTFVDRRYIQPASYYSDPLSPNFGKPEVYRITAPYAPGAATATFYIHESRCIRFDGAETDPAKRTELSGWTLSVLQDCYEAMRKFESAFQAAGYLLSDASQGVFKLAGLMEQIANDPETLRKRMELVEMNRSVSRAIMVDSELGEDFERKSTPLGNISEILDQMQLYLASAAEIPVTLLMGRSPAGMNATGEADFRGFYDTCRADQRDVLNPKLELFYEILGRAEKINTEGLEIRHHPLESLTAKEQADLEKICSERDTAYITQGVLLPEEVTLGRFGQGVAFSFTTPLTEAQLLSRQESLEAENRLADALAPPPAPETSPPAPVEGEDSPEAQ